MSILFKRNIIAFNTKEEKRAEKSNDLYQSF